MDKIHRPGRANKSSYSRGRPLRFSKPKQQQSNESRGKYKPAEVTSQDLCNNVGPYLLAMLGDLRDTLSGYRHADFRRDKNTISRRLAAEGVRFATERLPAFFDSVIEFTECGHSDFTGFKKPGTRLHPSFLQGITSPIFAEPTSAQAEVNVKHLYQLCVAFKKLQGPPDQSKVLKQLEDFVQTDIDLRSVDFSHEDARDIARRSKVLIGTVCEGLNPHDPDQAQDFLPRPGPGATNTPTKHAHRYRPRVCFDKLTSVFNPEEWYRPPFAPARKHARRWDVDYPTFTRLSRRHQKDLKLHRSDHVPRSRFKFVPKTYSKMRGICIEENEVQWHQQAIRNAMYKRIESHPLTKGHVNFTTQQVNRDLALSGSRTRYWATIDMSSASDRISRRLVRYLFSMNKPLLEAIEACSTDEVTLPDVKGLRFIEHMPLEKISPMGSAICFPVMSLVHYTLIRAILESSPITRHKAREVYVFGDDIIVPSECVQAVYEKLPLFGMKINTDKSFFHGHFRESCGCHAYNGVDVTPIRFKTVLRPESLPCELATALRLEESFYYKGYSKTARLLRLRILEVARKFRINTVPYVNTKSQLFGFYRKGCDARLMDFIIDHKRRWIGNGNTEVTNVKSAKSKYTQTWVYQNVATIVDKFDDKSSFLDEEDRYLRYLVQGGIWASKYYDEGFSRNTVFVRKNLIESSLGYSC